MSSRPKHIIVQILDSFSEAWMALDQSGQITNCGFQLLSGSCRILPYAFRITRHTLPVSLPRCNEVCINCLGGVIAALNP